MGEAALDTSTKHYRSRKPQNSQYYKCVQDHFEAFEQVYEEKFSRQYGFFRPYVKDVIYRYLDCGILQNGFARVKCSDCGHEYLLAFSCKRRHFCPSCHQKRVVEFGEMLCTEVLKKVPHRHFVFSIPKILRRYFLYDRKLLPKLSRCAWETLKGFYQFIIDEDGAVPGAAIAIQSFADFLGFNPHTHILVSDGCFYGEGKFKVAPSFKAGDLEAVFRGKIFKMLLNEGKINEGLISMLKSWRHSGFNVHCGERIWPDDETAMENIARYIIRASFSQERMTYIREEGKVIYKSKKGNQTKTFDALEWLAAMCSHVPNRGEQMVRYYGFYSNRSRGDRKKQAADDPIPYIIEGGNLSSAQRKAWARLIQKIYEVDPLCCPKCAGSMKIIAFIEQPETVRRILKHVGLWEFKSRPPPKIHSPPEIDYVDIQYPDENYCDPDYPLEYYIN